MAVIRAQVTSFNIWAIILGFHLVMAVIWEQVIHMDFLGYYLRFTLSYDSNGGVSNTLRMLGILSEVSTWLCQ